MWSRNKDSDVHTTLERKKQEKRRRIGGGIGFWRRRDLLVFFISPTNANLSKYPSKKDSWFFNYCGNFRFFISDLLEFFGFKFHICFKLFSRFPTFNFGLVCRNSLAIFNLMNWVLIDL